MSQNVGVVRDFCAAMIKRDVQVLVPFLASGAVYQNTGMPAVTGREAILADLRSQFERFPDSYEYRVINVAGDGDVVLTERLDMIRSADGDLVGVPVMGTFVLREGRITRWTDYWDLSLPRKMMTGTDFRNLVPDHT